MQIPTELQPMLRQFADRLTAELPETVVGLYLYGSIVFGAYDPEESDIDFLTVLHRPLIDVEIDRLEQIHTALTHAHPSAHRLDGGYIPLADLGRANLDIAPYPFHAMGAFHRSGRWDINNVTWWTLQHSGIAVSGPDPSHLGLDKGWEDLRHTMDYNLNVYWTRALQNFDTEITDKEIADSALTLCRILYTLQERTITSKTQAGRYALQKLPARWHRILGESLRIRERSADASLYDTREELLQDAQEFLQDMIELGNTRLIDSDRK